MEILRRLAKESVPDSPSYFSPDEAGFIYDTFRMTMGPDAAVQFHLQRKYADQLSEFAAEKLNLSSLSLIAIPRFQNSRLLISRDTYLEIFRSFGLDEWALYLDAHRYVGFHHVRDVNGQTTCYVGAMLYTIIWCTTTLGIHSSVQSTRVVVLIRDTDSLRGPDAIYNDLTTLLQKAAPYMGEALFMPFVVALDIVGWLERSFGHGFRSIRAMEANIGHGGWTYSTDYKASLKEIEALSKDVRSKMVKFADCFRHAETVQTLLNFVNDTYSGPEFARASGPGWLRGTADDFRAAVSVVRRQVDSCRASFQYIQDRLQSQANTLSAMLTHQDAIASIELADAAKRDGSSMKTIAIMTMAFLPATFFAALFALPSLQWDQAGGHIVQSNFWIYWAFTLPITALVFIVWILLNNNNNSSISRDFLWAHLRGKRKPEGSEYRKRRIGGPGS